MRVVVSVPVAAMPALGQCVCDVGAMLVLIPEENFALNQAKSEKC